MSIRILSRDSDYGIESQYEVIDLARVVRRLACSPRWVRTKNKDNDVSIENDKNTNLKYYCRS